MTEIDTIAVRQVRRAMIVDDDVDFASSLADMLQTRGIDCVIAHDMDSACEALSQSKPAVVLIDVRLGLSRGTELLARLRKIDPNVLCIMMTAYAGVDTAIEALRRGAYDYLRKPFRPDELFSTLDRCYETIELRGQKVEAEEALRARNEALHQVNDRLRQVVDATASLASFARLDELCPRLMEEFGTSLDAEGGSLYLEREGRLELAHSLDPGHAPEHIELPLVEGSPLARAMSTKKPVALSANGTGKIQPSGWTGYQDTFLMIFPFLDLKQEVIGLLSVHNRRGGAFTEQDLEIGKILASFASKAVRLAQTTEELTISRKRFAGIVELADEAIISIDESQTILSFNRCAERIFGYTEEEIIGKPLDTLVPVRFHSTHSDDVRGFAESEIPSRSMYDRKEISGLRKNGEEFPADGSILKFEIEGQMMMTAIVRDASKRKAVEAALRESEDRFRSTFEQAGVGIALVDLGGEFLRVNQRFRETLGYSEDELLGRNFLDFTHPEDLEAASEPLKRVWSGQMSSFEIEKRYLRKDGSVLWADLTVSLLRDSAGAPKYYIAAMLDISERKKTAEALAHREEELRQAQKMEAIGRLAGGVAHDFNNLLTVILGCGDVIYDRVSADNPIRAEISQIIEAGERAAALTNQLLIFSRKQVLLLKSVDLSQIITDMSLMLSRLIGEDVEMIIDLQADLVSVRADPSQIEQVVLNLVVNSRDAMPRGGSITIRTANGMIDPNGALAAKGAKPGPCAILSISDTGQGIDPEIIVRVFEPFFTTKDVGKGTGLGLATVHGIVKQSQGEIEVSSVLGEGTTFTAYFPMGDGDESDVQAVPMRIEDAGGSETILYVEDEDMIRDLAFEILKKSGYRVILARDGVEALDLIRESDNSIDLLISDVVMPRMSGPELAEAALKVSPDLRIFFVSGYSDDFLAGRDDIAVGIPTLAKPFRAGDLLSLVRSRLDET